MQRRLVLLILRILVTWVSVWGWRGGAGGERGVGLGSEGSGGVGFGVGWGVFFVGGLWCDFFGKLD